MDPIETTPQLSNENIRELHLQNSSLLDEIQTLRASNQILQSKLADSEELLIQIQLQKDDVLKQYVDISETFKEVSSERDSLRLAMHSLEASFGQREINLVEETERFRMELEVSKEKIDQLLSEKSQLFRVCSQNLEVVQSMKQGLMRMVENLGSDRIDNHSESKGDEKNQEIVVLSMELKTVIQLVNLVENRLGEYEEMTKKEKRELENSVANLTDENRDLNSLLRIALVEKEAVEKSLNRLRGNTEQKRGVILQIAERGLQKVGFGFGYMMGSATTSEPCSDNLDSDTSVKSDCDECQTESDSLASTMEAITKKLRLEIAQLQMSLDESRSDTERLQNLYDKQSQKLAENMVYIKELEDREIMVTEKVEELMVETKVAEEEISRWREACEMEVEAGKKIVKEHEQLVNILKQELEKSRAALHISNSKLQLKEDLVAAAIAAQEAAERSLELADSRATEQRKQIEELTRQLEGAEKRERINRRRLRHMCWPWRGLKLSPANNTTGVRNVTRMLPEMQAFLH